MKHRYIIYRNRLEEYVKDLYFEQRKTLKEVAETIEKERQITISHEAVRRFIKQIKPHGKAGKYTEKQG